MALQGPLGYQPNIGRMRPSDADRRRAVDVLASAFAEGRLDGEQHRHRIEKALKAGSYQELSDLTSDLPVGPLPIPGQSWPAALPYGYGPSQPYRPASQVDGCAVASLVLALMSPFAFFLVGLPSVAAIVTGHIALARADERGSGSKGLAITGLVLGYLGTALALLFLVIAVVS